MKTIETKVYEYNELSDKAKEKAMQWFSEGVFDYDWWNCTHEDANNIGLKITAFDLDRNRHAKGEFITSAPECAESILKEHGESCETFKTAKAYLQSLEQLDLKYPYDDIDDRAEGYDDEREELDDDFLKSLLEDYSIMLQHKSDYMQSEEYLSEGIIANEYTFTEDGKRFG